MGVNTSSKPKKIPSGCLCLDRLLQGGLPEGQISTFYGEASSGKTTIALQCSIICARSGFYVLYVDSDLSFSVERVFQMAPDFEEVASYIKIFTPKNFFEQTVLIENFETHINSTTGLIVFDTINGLYRIALESSEKNFLLNKELNRQIAYLFYYAQKHSLPVLLTSQVHGVIGEKGELVKPVATRILEFWSQNIVRLSLTGKPGLRRAYLEKIGGRFVSNVFCQYSLTSSGVE
ncbi:MAG: ATPase domain-containing protein [Candidatus Bathyarchaeota archaeon]